MVTRCQVTSPAVSRDWGELVRPNAEESRNRIASMRVQHNGQSTPVRNSPTQSRPLGSRSESIIFLMAAILSMGYTVVYAFLAVDVLCLFALPPRTYYLPDLAVGVAFLGVGMFTLLRRRALESRHLTGSSHAMSALLYFAASAVVFFVVASHSAVTCLLWPIHR